MEEMWDDETSGILMDSRPHVARLR